MFSFCLSDGYAPFLSMSLRDSFLTIKESVAAAPGPGAYNPRLIDFVQGGSSLANQGSRFVERYSETPGPGCYSLSKESDWLKNARSLRSADVHRVSILLLRLELLQNSSKKFSLHLRLQEEECSMSASPHLHPSLHPDKRTGMRKVRMVLFASKKFRNTTEP